MSFFPFSFWRAKIFLFQEVEILDEHDHQPDQVFILREVCRNILYRYISKNNIQQKYDEILTVLQGIAPDLLGGKILPRYGIAKRRVFDIKLSDEDVNRAQWLYEKNSQRSNTTGPPNKKHKSVVKNEGEFNFLDTLYKKLIF